MGWVVFVGQQAVLVVCTDLSTQVPFRYKFCTNRWTRAVVAVPNGIATPAEPCCIIHPGASDVAVCKLTLLKADLASQCTTPGVQINYSLHPWQCQCRSRAGVEDFRRPWWWLLDPRVWIPTTGTQWLYLCWLAHFTLAHGNHPKLLSALLFSEETLSLKPRRCEALQGAGRARQ